MSVRNALWDVESNTDEALWANEQFTNFTESFLITELTEEFVITEESTASNIEFILTLD